MKINYLDEELAQGLTGEKRQFYNGVLRSFYRNNKDLTPNAAEKYMLTKWYIERLAEKDGITKYPPDFIETRKAYEKWRETRVRINTPLSYPGIARKNHGVIRMETELFFSKF